jgi:hypothetical protein
MKTIKKMRGAIMAMVGQANENDISFFDVKELYDSAYAEKAIARDHIRRFKTLMAQAELLETAYRSQLAARRPGPAVLSLSEKVA